MACTLAHAWLGGVGIECTKFEHTLVYMHGAKSTMPLRGREIAWLPQRAAWGAYISAAGPAAPRRGGHSGGLTKMGVMTANGWWLCDIKCQPNVIS